MGSVDERREVRSSWFHSYLTLIVKRVSGKTLKDFAEGSIFHPLRMVHTQFRNDHTSLIPHRALAYDPSEGGGYKLSVSYAEETGDGMLQTSIEDLQKWDENFYSAQVGGNGFTAELEDPGRLNDGTALAHAKGLFLSQYRGLRTVKYSGGSRPGGTYWTWGAHVLISARMVVPSLDMLANVRVNQVGRTLARRSSARAATPCAARSNRSDNLDFIV